MRTRGSVWVAEVAVVALVVVPFAPVVELGSDEVDETVPTAEETAGVVVDEDARVLVEPVTSEPADTAVTGAEYALGLSCDESLARIGVAISS
jgi:hypothetical protein